MPRRFSSFWTAFARRSDRARLYAAVPDVSAWPVAVMCALPVFFAVSAACATIFWESARKVDLSKSKNTRNFDSAIGAGGGAAARGAGGGAIGGGGGGGALALTGSGAPNA